jgi:DNA-binding LytR/AlgR family response regulator
MEKINVMVVEDIQLIAEDIASKLRKHGMLISGIYNTGEAAIASLEASVPDLIIMDIRLAGAFDGISTAKVIGDKLNVPVIFLTDITDDSTFQRATKTFPASYLSKPFNEADLVRTATIAYTNYKRSGKQTRAISDHIFVKIQNGQQQKLMYDEIFYLEANGAYCNILTIDKSYVVVNSLNHVLAQLDPKHFVRVHRSYAVNINKVTKLDGNRVILGNHRVDMSSSLRDQLTGKLNILK